MIREATVGDIPAILGMAQRFAEAAGMEGKTGFDPETVETLVAGLIESPLGIVLLMEGGMAGGLVVPSMFNRHHVSGQELFWWVDPEARGQGKALFRSLEAAAKERGAHSWVMSSVGLEDDRLARFYQRAGYAPLDRNFLKVF